MLKVGFGKREITPGMGTPLGGYAVPGRVAESVNDPLHAQCIALEDASCKAAWIVLDWLSLDGTITAKIRQAVATVSGLPAEAVHVSATHTHSAPNTLNFPCFGAIVWDYINEVLPSIAAAAADALADLHPVKVGFAEIRSRTGVNRRAVSEHHDTRFLADPHGAIDDTMTVMAFRDDKKIRGILVHYGAHATAMGVDGTVSRDWPGIMKDRIASQFHAPVLFFNGALGDVGPRSNFRSGEYGLSGGTGDGIEAVREVGYRAASDAIEALLTIRDYRDCRFSIRTQTMTLPYRPLLPRGEAEHLLRNGNAGETAYAQMVLKAHEQPLRDSIRLPATALLIGPAAFLLMPGELFADIALRLRRQSPYAHTLCCSLTDENLAYLVTREARNRGGYEVEAGMYAGAYLLSEHIDDILVDNYTALLKNDSIEKKYQQKRTDAP